MENEKQKSRGGIHYAWWILVACCFLQAIGVGLVNNTASLFVVPVTTELGFDRAPYSIWLTVKSLVVVVMTPIAMKLFAKYGIKKLLCVGIIVNAGMYALLALGQDLWLWYTVGVISGIAASFIHVVPSAILLNRWFTERLGFATGVAAACSGLGGALFNPIIGAIISSFGWRGGYLGTAIIAVVLTLPFALLVVKDKPADIGLASYGAEKAAAAAQTAAAAVDERGVTKESAYRNPAFYLLIFFTLLISCTAAITQHIGAYVLDIGLAMTFAAMISSILMIAMAVGKIILGILNDKIGIKASATLYVAILVIGIFIFASVGANVPLVAVGIVLIGMGISLVTVQPPVATAKIYGKKYYAEIYSFIGMMVTGGNAVFVTVLGFIYDTTQSYLVGFYVLAGMAVLALVCYLIAMAASKNLKWE